MSNTLPPILNTAALTHADPAGAAGMASRDSAESGNGFAALMQQQTDLRLAQQRLSEQRSSEQRLAGQRQSEPRTAASSASPPAPHAEPQVDAQPSNEASAAVGVPASQPASTGRAGAGDTASAVAGSTRRRRAAEAAAEDQARATTTAGAATLARARNAALADGTGAADLTAADDSAATEPPPETTAPISATTAANAAAPDASALQPWLQAQALVTGWQPAAGLEARALAAHADVDFDADADAAAAAAASASPPVAALPDRSLRGIDALTTTGLSGLSTANGESPVVPRTLPDTEPGTAPARTEAHHRPAGPALATGPMTAGLPTATDDPRLAGRTARRAAAVEIARTPADATQPLASAHTPVAQAAEAALALAPASPARPTAVADPTQSDAAEGIEPAAIIANPVAPASKAVGDVVAAAAAAALATQTIASAPRPAAAATAAAAPGTAAASAMTLTALGPQLRAGSTRSTTAGPERARIGDSADAGHSGPVGSARPDGTAVAARHPEAPDLRPAGNPSTDPLPREATSEDARQGAEAVSNDRHEALGLAPEARPAEPTGVLIPAATGARPDHQAASTRADLLRVAEAGPTQANPNAQVPAATAAPASTTTAAGTLPAAAGPVHEARIPVPLDSPAFAPALGSQISLFAREGVQTARLQLNPAEMGPISVQIALDGNAARVDFQADLAGTREVIEASLPALAGALQDAGLTLAGGGVFQQSPGQQGQGDAASAAAPRHGAGRDATTDADGPAPAPVVRERRGLVDLVA
jgi:flagellar hook-length control protein FliK